MIMYYLLFFFLLLLLYTAIVHQAFIPKMCLQCKIDQHDMLGNKLEKFDFLDHIEDRCDYFEVDDRHSWFCRSQDLTIMQLNIRGLIGKQHELLKLANSLCGTQKLDIILLQETWLKKDTLWRVDIPGYKHYAAHRINKNSGGVSILVNDNLKSRQLPLDQTSQYFKSIVVEVQL